MQQYLANDQNGIPMPALEAGYQVAKSVGHVEGIQVALLSMPVSLQLDRLDSPCCLLCSSA